MSYCNRNIYEPPACPNCGKEKGAIMGCSSWGHSMSCCGDECGHAVKKKIDKNESSEEYKKKLRQFYNLKNKLVEMRYEGIDAIDQFYDFL